MAKHPDQHTLRPPHTCVIPSTRRLGLLESFQYFDQLLELVLSFGAHKVQHEIGLRGRVRLEVLLLDRSDVGQHRGIDHSRINSVIASDDLPPDFLVAFLLVPHVTHVDPVIAMRVVLVSYAGIAPSEKDRKGRVVSAHTNLHTRGVQFRPDFDHFVDDVERVVGSTKEQHASVDGVGVAREDQTSHGSEWLIRVCRIPV